MKDRQHREFNKHAKTGTESRASDPGGAVRPDNHLSPAGPKDSIIPARSAVLGRNRFAPWNHTRAGEAMNKPVRPAK